MDGFQSSYMLFCCLAFIPITWHHIILVSSDPGLHGTDMDLASSSSLSLVVIRKIPLNSVCQVFERASEQVGSGEVKVR